MTFVIVECSEDFLKVEITVLPEKTEDSSYHPNDTKEDRKKTERRQLEKQAKYCFCHRAIFVGVGGACVPTNSH